MNAVFDNCEESSPYLLANESCYQDWRQNKLELCRQHSPTRIFRLDQQGLLPADDLAAVQQQIDAFNFVIFESQNTEFGKLGLVSLGHQFGLYHMDNNPGADSDQVTSLQVVAASDERAQYIPYTNRAMNWHTDGYYNPEHRRINAFALYCVHQAARGGDNYLFDHDMMYLLMRDRAPKLVEALMDEELMRIPANVQGNRVLRAEETGPVFSLRAPSCALNMSYTSRPQNIVWKSDQRSQQALNLVREILMEGSAMVEIRLSEGQGLICNNVLHGRQAFHNDTGKPARLVYRARYYDAIKLEQGVELEKRSDHG